MKVFHEDERGLFIWTGRQKQRVKVIDTNGQEVTNDDSTGDARTDSGFGPATAAGTKREATTG